MNLAELGWQLTRTEPGAAIPYEPGGIDARVPGTAAGALLAAGLWDGVSPLDPDASDWWWQSMLPAELAGPGTLEFGGVATVSEVWLDGVQVAAHDGMFTSFTVDIDVPTGGARLAVVARALGPLLAARRPRAAWKTKLVRQQNLRWYRTSLLGRMPGFSPYGAPAGPWRPVLLHRLDADRVTARHVVARLDGDRAVVDVDLTMAGAAPSAATLTVGAATRELAIEALDAGAYRIHGSVDLDAVERWWPAGYGAQPLYDLGLHIDGRALPLGRVGFRDVTVDRSDGAFQPAVNGQRVFLPGACWVRPGGAALQASDDEIRAGVHTAHAAGIRMLRITGTTVYESAAFWDACDQLGILVWQDAMVANLAPPDEPASVAVLADEVRRVLAELGGRPSLAVFCGASEVEQQAAMLGLDADRRALPVLTETLPRVVAACAPGLTYVVSSPTGGEPPFRPDTGVAHYFGVGAYLRPPDDFRTAGVRFAAECLAFANPPDAELVDAVFGSAAAAGHTPEWKRGVPRDAGAPWDFEDVRDVYVDMLFGVDTRRLRFTDPERYLDLGRAAVAYLIQRTMAGWRDARSGCGGALVLALADLVPGAGWGLVAADGRPKSAWHGFRRACAPLAVQVADRGMNGLEVLVWSDGPDELEVTLEVTVYARGETVVGSGSRELVVPGRGQVVVDVESVLGGFRDVGWAYRFGPAAADAVAVYVRTADGSEVSDLYFPTGLAGSSEPDIGLTAELDDGAPDAAVRVVRVGTRRCAQFVTVDALGWVASDGWFHLAPGHIREVALTRAAGSRMTRPPRGEVRAVNSVARLTFR